MTLHQAELMGDLAGDFSNGAQLGVHQDVCAPVKGLPLGEQLPNSRHWVGTVEQRAMALPVDTLPDGFRGGPKADDHGVVFKAVQVVRIGAQTAAGSENGPGARGEAGDDLLFELPEPRFAFEPEDLGDELAGLALDEFVGVDHLEMQLAGQQVRDRAFPRAHEPDEGDVLNLPSLLHLTGLA